MKRLIGEKNEKREKKSTMQKIDWSINSNWQIEEERNDMFFSAPSSFKERENLIHTFTDFNWQTTKQNVCLFRNIKKEKANYIFFYYSLSSVTAVATYLLLYGISLGIASQA